MNIDILQKPALLSQSALARRLDVAAQTLRRHIADKTVEPDFIESGRLLFKEDRVLELKDQLKRPLAHAWKRAWSPIDRSNDPEVIA